MRASIDFPFIPPTGNEVIRLCKENKFEYARQKKKYTDYSSLAAIGCPQFPGQVWMRFEWRICTFNRDPVDNLQTAAKPILDGLVRLGVIVDDSAKIIQSPCLIEWKYAKQEGLTLTISDRPFIQIRYL